MTASSSPRRSAAGISRAARSPAALALAGVGAGIALLAGAPLVVVPVAAAAGWASRVAVAVVRPGRGPRPERIDPFTVNEPWRRFVRDALQARNRFGEAVRTSRPGPLRDRLGEIGERLEVGVGEVWRVARKGQELAQARRALDARGIARRAEELEATLAAAPDDPGRATDERAIEALRAQLATVERLDRVIADAEARLRLLDARLEEAVARALEVSVQAGDPDVLGIVGADVDDLVLEVEALRLALEETSGRGGPGDELGPAAGDR